MADIYKCEFDISCLISDDTKGHEMKAKMNILSRELSEMLSETYNARVTVTPRAYRKRIKEGIPLIKA